MKTQDWQLFACDADFADERPAARTHVRSRTTRWEYDRCGGLKDYSEAQAYELISQFNAISSNSGVIHSILIPLLSKPTSRLEILICNYCCKPTSSQIAGGPFGHRVKAYAQAEPPLPLTVLT
jgi:hypothetical protein